jgi:hypothetical protein
MHKYSYTYHNNYKYKYIWEYGDRTGFINAKLAGDLLKVVASPSYGVLGCI